MNKIGCWNCTSRKLRPNKIVFVRKEDSFQEQSWGDVQRLIRLGKEIAVMFILIDLVF
jgi:hypothetical protein